MPNRPSSLHMQILGKQFASGFTGKLNFLATAAHQWKAAFWFKQGRMINFCYHQQWAAAALFNFCYDFAPVLTALAEEGQHPLAPLTWVAEPEIFSRGEAWSWSWQDFCQAWQQQAQMAMQYRRKAPRPQYQLRVAL
ncbi:MAG: hypothetical protein J6Y94_02330, partial [Bacteriovoracaceae bacterium]|nr:hypothetical protein [Bacteriovoracaceae bacterium]